MSLGNNIFLLFLSVQGSFKLKKLYDIVSTLILNQIFANLKDLRALSELDFQIEILGIFYK